MISLGSHPGRSFVIPVRHHQASDVRNDRARHTVPPVLEFFRCSVDSEDSDHFRPETKRLLDHDVALTRGAGSGRDRPFVRCLQLEARSGAVREEEIRHRLESISGGPWSRLDVVEEPHQVRNDGARAMARSRGCARVRCHVFPFIGPSVVVRPPMKSFPVFPQYRHTPGRH